MDQNEIKISRIRKIKNNYFSFLRYITKKRNKKIEEIIKKDDDNKIKDILSNLK